MRDALRHRKYLGVMSAAVDDKAHYTNRCVPRTVQNTLAVPKFTLYFQHSVKYFILMKEAVGSPRKLSTFTLDYTALHVNDRKRIVKKQRNNPCEFSSFTSIVSQTATLARKLNLLQNVEPNVKVEGM
jgi:hypothetical protein